MIQLGLTRTRMLADIGAPEDALAAPPLAPEDPGFVEGELVRLVVRAHDRHELFGRLEPALRRRFSRSADEHLHTDLLMPLRKATGNCHRRGNLEDPAKWLSAEVIATRRGAVVSVSDEGRGFDVERIVSQFGQGERYFTREGHGIEYFARTSSLVSYADGGRTWLLRFLADPEPGQPLDASEGAALGSAADPEYMRSFLAERVAAFRDRGMRPDSCRVYTLEHEHGTNELVYVVRSTPPDRPTETRVLTGRLLDDAAARADVGMAEQLRGDGVGVSEGLQVPTPLGAWADPPLSLFELDPSESLRKRARKMSGLKPLALVLHLIALGLAAIHQSSAAPVRAETIADVLDEHRKAKQRVEPRLSGRGPGPRAGASYERLLQQARDLSPHPAAPIHGALEWDCFVTSDERWSLYRLDQSRMSHPLVDVGTFLADLQRFHGVRKKGEPGLAEAGRAAFLDGYFRGRSPPWSRDVDWFVASALLQRFERLLRRPEEKWAPKVDPLLDQVEQALDRHSGPA